MYYGTQMILWDSVNWSRFLMAYCGQYYLFLPMSTAPASGFPSCFPVEHLHGSFYNIVQLAEGKNDVEQLMLIFIKASLSCSF